MAKALTAISIEKLKPHPVRREIPDARMPGLYLIVQPSGAKSWAVRYRHVNKPRKLTIGGYPAFDLLKARKRASEALQAVADGHDPAKQKRRAKEAAKLGKHDRDSFASVVRVFINRHAKANNRSWKPWRAVGVSRAVVTECRDLCVDLRRVRTNMLSA